MVKKLLIIAFALAIFLVPATLAIQTQIDITTAPYKDVTLSVLQDSEQYQSIRSYASVFSGNRGKVSIIHDGEESNFKIRVIVKEQGQVVATETFGGQTAGGVINLEVFPSGYDPDEETESSNSDSDAQETGDGDKETDATETESSDLELTTKESTDGAGSSGVTGFSFIGEQFQKFSSIFYIVVIVLIVGALGFFIYRRMRAGPPHVVGPKETKPKRAKKESSFQNLASAAVTAEDVAADMAGIAEAERKIKEAQLEINRIKNKAQIDAAERKLKQDQEALERMKRGEDGPLSL